MNSKTVIAFANGSKKIASGPLALVAEKVKSYLQAHSDTSVLFFDLQSSQPVEVDLRGTPESVRRRIEKVTQDQARQNESGEKRSGPGRPKLGVIAKEVTLLPHHWEWLAEQSGGASVTLRKLVDAAMKKNAGRDELRRVQEATYRFLHAVCGDRENYEDVLRALYAQDADTFKRLMSAWPKDVRDHALALSQFV